MVDNRGNKIVIREYNEDRDIEVVGKLEKKCEVGSNEDSIFTNMMGDPLCRIRFYPIHVMLVAELRENGELVGVVRGCIKCVGTRFGAKYVSLGCILGLRVSPRHRRMGIGLRLVRSMEEWLIIRGAQYTFLATEKNNVASCSLFTTKCNYVHLSSLVIFAQPANLSVRGLSEDIKIERLRIDQAIALYNSKLREKDIYPTDIETILKEKQSLGTWVSYFKEEEWITLHSNQRNLDIVSKTPSTWVIFSIWNSCKAYKLHIRKSHSLKVLQTTLSHASEKIFPCLKSAICPSLRKPFGFLLLYGLYGEGERLQELTKSIWSFASRLAENMKDCNVIITELGVSDPLMEHMPLESSTSCINDLWYLKKVNGQADERDQQVVIGQVGDVFVDPRDF